MAWAHKINVEFANTSLTTNLEDEDYKLQQRHRYSSYNKSILVSKPHGSSTNLSERTDKDHSCCKRLCSCISYYIPILHPFGPFKCTWDLLVMIMLVYTCVEVPVTLAFNIDLKINHFSGIIALTIDILLLIDILITYRTAYFDKWDRLRLIIDECEIAKRYIIGWFFIDLFTSLPFEFMLPGKGIVKFVKVLRVFRFIRIIKILRLFKMIKYFDGFMSQFVIREVLVVLKFLKIFALMILFAHISACAWFFVGRMTINTDKYWSPNGSWVGLHFDNTDLNYIDSLPTFTKYSYSWYWAVVTLFTTGYGDVVATPGNKLEQWTVSICILVGTCFFAYFIGTLTSLITEGDRIKSVEIQKLEEAQAFCDHKKLPRELSRAVLSHIRYHCGYNYVFDESELIQSLPPYLQNDIHTYLAQTILMQLDFFKSFKKNLQILGQISLKMRSISCNENYSLFQKGDRAKEIYIQRTGESIINYYDGTSKILKRGDVIGERSMVSPKRKFTVQCITFSEFYVLSVQDIVSILQTEYPTTWTKRWRNMVKQLKLSLNKNKKYIRTVNFNKYDHHHDNNKSQHGQTPQSPGAGGGVQSIKIKTQHETIPSTQLPTTSASASRNGFNAWVTQPSTIKTAARLSMKGGKVNKIKSVRLNAVGAVDTPVHETTVTTTTLSVNKIDENKPFDDNNNIISKSDGKIIETSNNKTENNNFLNNRSKSMMLPALKESRSHPAPKTNTNNSIDGKQNQTTRKKGKARFGIFVRRNSLDRDAAIHDAARKRAATHGDVTITTKPTTHRSFYDLEGSTSGDSSDDSGDIVPHDYDDNDAGDDDYEISKTYTNHNYHNMDIGGNGMDDDMTIVNVVDNMEQMYRKFTKLANNNININMNDSIPTAIRTNNIQRKAKVNVGSSGRKGGKFGAKKRRPPMTSKKKNNMNINNRNNNKKKSSFYNERDIKKNMKKQVAIKMKEEFIQNINKSKIKPLTPMSPVESNSSITYNPVDNMIMNDLKINKNNNNIHNQKNSNSETKTEIIYEYDDDDDDEKEKDKKNNKQVKFKDEIIENNNNNNNNNDNDNDNDDNNGFVISQDYKYENDNQNENNEYTGDNSDSTKL